jgi:hypothetical protein
MKIEFSNEDNLDYLFPPVPARNLLPEWFKKTHSYLNDKKEFLTGQATTATVKKCVPVFDAITAGYIILSPTDLQITQTPQGPKFMWPYSDLINSQSNLQAFFYPDIDQINPIYKWRNKWSIKTPKGYSCFFMPPMHREKQPFRILEGVVDTDNYQIPVEFPFVLNDANFEGIIPAGTPIAQVVPFKRDGFEMEIKPFNYASHKKSFATLRQTFFNGYRDRFWSRKEYK